MSLHPDFLRLPIAHRGLHGPGVPENSLAAVRAAVAAGYGIEIDVQPAAGGEPVVFHDYDLGRLAGVEGFIADMPLEALRELRLAKGDEPIPTLQDVLREVAGRVPLLVEIKDQDGRLGPQVGTLPERTAAVLKGYDGPVAVMSFSPDTAAAVAKAAPDLAVGLVTCGFAAEDWPMLDTETRVRLAAIPDAARVGACFVSHDHRDLANPALLALKAQGLAILGWTIRSDTEEAAARQVCDNVTFEGYAAARP